MTRRILGTILLLAAFAQLGFRGMQRIRSEIPMWDFASVYAATRAWTHGEDPYQRAAVMRTWRDTGAYNDRDASYFATVYPPPSLLLLVPFALLPVHAAMTTWLIVTLALLILQFFVLADLADWRWDDPRALILLGASLASAPFQFGLLSGQLSMPAVFLCVIAFGCERHGKERTAGVLLGLACALKPQVGAPFLIFYLLLRQWKVGITAVLCGGAIAVVSLIAMGFSHVDWISGWTQSVAATQQQGGVNDYGWTNDFRDEIVDLKIILVSFIRDQRVLRASIEISSLALIGWYLWAFPRDRLRGGRVKHGGGSSGRRRELILLATLSAISLLPMYHRIYDVTLLTTALVWALTELDGPFRKSAWALLLPMLLFLIPFDVVEAIGRRKANFLVMTQTRWWQSLLAPHYAWGLLASAITLLVILSRSAMASEEPSRSSIAEQ